MSRSRVPLVVLGAVGLAAAVAGFLVVRTSMAPPADEDAPADVEPEADLGPGERFEKVGSITRDVFESFPGKVAAGGGTPVTVPPGMRVAVTEILKTEGDVVKKDDVLLRFNRDAILREIEKAEGAGRTDDAKRFREYLAYADLKAPCDGVVRDVWTELGRVPVDEGHTALVTIVDAAAFQFRVNVPEALLKTVGHLGARVSVDLEGSNGRAEGTVSVHEAAPPGWVGLVVALDPRQGYEADMLGTLRAPTSKQEVALVPKSAVRTRDGVKVVRVWEPGDGTAADRGVRERTILTDGEKGDDWIVVAGVLPGESVVVRADR